MMTVTDFRAMFPHLTSDLYADATVEFWLNFALSECPADRWGTKRETGAAFLAAHHLTLLKAAGKAADGTGGMEVAQGGVISESKSVGGISISRNRAGAAATGDAAATHYNDTIYGKQYWSFVQTIGMGGVVV